MGLGLVTPAKRLSGQQLSAEAKRNNRVLNRLRSVVEWVIAQVKCWVVLYSGFRQPFWGIWAGICGGAGVGVFGCWARLMNNLLDSGI